jgi:hypothetical protein
VSMNLFVIVLIVSLFIHSCPAAATSPGRSAPLYQNGNGTSVWPPQAAADVLEGSKHGIAMQILNADRQFQKCNADILNWNNVWEPNISLAECLESGQAIVDVCRFKNWEIADLEVLAMEMESLKIIRLDIRNILAAYKKCSNFDDLISANINQICKTSVGLSQSLIRYNRLLQDPVDAVKDQSGFMRHNFTKLIQNDECDRKMTILETTLTEYICLPWRTGEHSGLGDWYKILCTSLNLRRLSADRKQIFKEIE